MEYIHRAIEEQIIKASKNFPVIVLTGARQTGKSTVLNYLAGSKHIDIKNKINLKDLSVRNFAKNDPIGFLNQYSFPILIDEIQMVPELFDYMKIIVDKQRILNKENSYGMFYLTGSHKIELMKNVSESLAGIAGIFTLLPLSNAEIFKFQSVHFIPKKDFYKNRINDRLVSKSDIFERIFKGSYPEIYVNKNIDCHQYYDSYVKTFLEKDIREVSDIQDILKYKKFVENLATRTGQELSYESISKDLDIKAETIKRWISILETMDIIFLLQPYSGSLLNRIVKRPKIYFNDTGLACYLSGITDAKTLEISYLNGAFYETFVVNEIVKSYTNDGLASNKYFFYIRDNNQREIDFIIDINCTLYPIEIKMSSTPNSVFFKNFSMIKKVNLRTSNVNTVIYSSNVVNNETSTNIYIPLCSI